MPGIPIFTDGGLPFFTPDGKPSFCEEDCLCEIPPCPECCVQLSASETRLGDDTTLSFDANGDLKKIFARDATSGIQTTITIVMPTKDSRFICDGQSITIKIDFDLEVGSPHPAPFAWFGAMWKHAGHEPAVGENGRAITGGLIEWGEPTDELEAIKTAYEVTLDYTQCVRMLDSCEGNRISAGSRTVPSHTVSLWGYSCPTFESCCDQDQGCTPCCIYLEPNDGGGGCDTPELTWWDESDQAYYLQRSIEGWTVRLKVPILPAAETGDKLICVDGEVTITMQIIPPSYAEAAIDAWETKPYFRWTCATWDLVSATAGHILTFCEGCGVRWEDTELFKTLEYSITLRLNCDLVLRDIVAGLDNLEDGTVQTITLPGIGLTEVSPPSVVANFLLCADSDACCPPPPECEPCCFAVLASGFNGKSFGHHHDGIYGEVIFCGGGDDDGLRIRFSIFDWLNCENTLKVAIDVFGTPFGTICAYPEGTGENYEFAGVELGESIGDPSFKCMTLGTNQVFLGSPDTGLEPCEIGPLLQVVFEISDNGVILASVEFAVVDCGPGDPLVCCEANVRCCSTSCYLPVGNGCEESEYVDEFGNIQIEYFEAGGPTRVIDARVEAAGFVLEQVGLSRHMTHYRSVEIAGAECAQPLKCISLCELKVDMEVTTVPAGEEAFLGQIRTLTFWPPGSFLCGNCEAWTIWDDQEIIGHFAMGGLTDLASCAGPGTLTNASGAYHEFEIIGPIPIAEGFRCADPPEHIWDEPGWLEHGTGESPNETWTRIVCRECCEEGAQDLGLGSSSCSCNDIASLMNELSEVVI